MKLKLILCSLCALFLGIVGCNIFNPTESANIESGDANALTYEGYIKFRANDYDEAERYFSKAIEADPSHSEAWYGLAKAKLNQQEINVFELLKYVNTNSKSSLPIAGMSDGMAAKYQESIDYIMSFLKDFITRDTTGQLDGVVTYRTIANSYMLLESFQFMLVLRKEMPFVAKCQQTNPRTGLPDCNIGDILNGLQGGKGARALSMVHDMTKTCEQQPEGFGSVLGQMIPGVSDMLTAKGKNETTSAVCGAIASVTQPSENPNEIEKNLSLVSSMSGYSMVVDEDGDGCVDEEVPDGFDNDGDGEVDEDPRNLNSGIQLDEVGMSLNVAYGHTGIQNLMLIQSVSPDEKYRSVDIDLDGRDADDDEWTFVYAKIADRKANNDHRFKFATKLVYNPQGMLLDQFMSLKWEVAHDYQGVYDLEFRKTHIGGCWPNYKESDFQRHLEATAERYRE
jgi:hypothetical protein